MVCHVFCLRKFNKADLKNLPSFLLGFVSAAKPFLTVLGTVPLKDVPVLWTLKLLLLVLIPVAYTNRVCHNSSVVLAHGALVFWTLSLLLTDKSAFP